MWGAGLIRFDCHAPLYANIEVTEFGELNENPPAPGIGESSELGSFADTRAIGPHESSIHLNPSHLNPLVSARRGDWARNQSAGGSQLDPAAGDCQHDDRARARATPRDRADVRHVHRAAAYIVLPMQVMQISAFACRS